MESSIVYNKYDIDRLDELDGIGFWVTMVAIFLAFSCAAAHANPVVGGAKIIAAGEGHTVVVRRDGTAWTWGDNTQYQLGDNRTDMWSDAVLPVQVFGLVGVVSVSAGTSHTLALKADGTVWAWGYNGSGLLGDGTTGGSARVPVQAQRLSGVVAVSAGKNHSVALKSDGTVWAWGWNAYGQVGDGTQISRSIPVQVSNLANVLAVSAGQDATAALKADGTVWTWGSNYYGALGEGDVRNPDGQRLIPAQVSGLADVVSVSVGNHAVAVKTDGTVWAWGDNGDGQLGDGTKAFRTHPVQVSGLGGVVSASAGRASSRNTVVLKSDSTVWAWGNNDVGQLGNGTFIPSSYPVQVSRLASMVAMDFGREHGVATKSDGTVWTWGANGSGQLGDGTKAMHIEPVQVSGISDVGTTTPTECLFMWAEKNYPSLFAPSGSASANWPVYHYRYYSATNAYLAVSSVDNHVYYIGSDGILQNAGPTSYWLPQAGCQASATPNACLFNWVEGNYPALFAPAGAATATFGAYTYRRYPTTNAYLGISSTNNDMYYMGPDGISHDEGPSSHWLFLAGCQ